MFRHAFQYRLLYAPSSAFYCAHVNRAFMNKYIDMDCISLALHTVHAPFPSFQKLEYYLNTSLKRTLQNSLSLWYFSLSTSLWRTCTDLLLSAYWINYNALLPNFTIETLIYIYIHCICKPILQTHTRVAARVQNGRHHFIVHVNSYNSAALERRQIDTKPTNF